MESLGSGRALCSFIVEDITDRKRTEADLLDAKELAEAASRAKDRFLAVLSHELRTPLTPVLIAVASLLESKPEAPLLQTLEMIRRNIELEARLIDDLLDLSRIVRGRLRLELEVVDIHKLIRRAMEICRDETLIAGLHVLTELKAPHHHVTADHARIMQVVWNLIRNAAKFTPAGGTADDPHDQPAPAPPNDPGEGDAGWLAIEFEDTGIGIDPEVLPRMFDPFEQGDDDLRGRSGGLGLGLAISRSLAEALGGRLTASSPGRGHGSTFRLELKVVPQSASPKTPKTNAQNARLCTGRIQPATTCAVLLVEDNKDTLRYLATVLRKRGHQVVTADCFAAALAALKEAEAPFDLLISDIELPDGDGLQLMREIKASERMAGIAMSGFGAEEDLRQSREAGFFDHLTKPIDLTRLDNAIQQRHRRRRRAATTTPTTIPNPSVSDPTATAPEHSRSSGRSSRNQRIRTVRCKSERVRCGFMEVRRGARPAAEPAMPPVSPRWGGRPPRAAHPRRFVAELPRSARCLARHWLGSYRSNGRRVVEHLPASSHTGFQSAERSPKWAAHRAGSIVGVGTPPGHPNARRARAARPGCRSPGRCGLVATGA